MTPNQVLLSFILLLVAGMTWQFIPTLPDRVSLRSNLSTAVLWVFLPALFFRAVMSAPLSSDFIKIPVIGAISCLVTLLISWLIHRVLLKQPEDRPKVGALLLGSAWPNVTYFGLPMITSLFGESVTRVPALIDMLCLTPLLFTVGTSIGLAYGTKKEPSHSALTALLRLPPFWAIILAVILGAFSIKLPTDLDKALGFIGSAVAPIMIFCVGLAMKLDFSLNSLALMMISVPAIALKLIFEPLVSIGVTHFSPWLRMSEPMMSATIIETGMPSMILPIVISEKFGLHTETLARTILLSTLISFASIPLILSFINLFYTF